MSVITLTAVGEATKNGKAFYIPIEYMDKGKQFKKKVMDFVNKDIYNLMKNVTVGEQFEVAIEKDDNGYWQWKTVTKVDGKSAASVGSVAASTTRSTYETPEERAHRQVLIVRQSCLAQAIATGTVGMSLEDITDRAEQYEAWVNRSTKESVND